MMSRKTLSLAAGAAALVACLAIFGQNCEARGLDGQQEGFLQSQNMPSALDLQQQQQQQLLLQQANSRASLELDDDDDDDDRADQQQVQQLAQAGSALYQQNEQPIVMATGSGDLNPAASKHYHHGHGAKGWLDMGAWTGKKGAFGWYDKHPVGKGK